jgi:hypothetical protein
MLCWDSLWQTASFLSGQVESICNMSTGCIFPYQPYNLPEPFCDTSFVLKAKLARVHHMVRVEYSFNFSQCDRRLSVPVIRHIGPDAVRAGEECPMV